MLDQVEQLKNQEQRLHENLKTFDWGGKNKSLRLLEHLETYIGVGPDRRAVEKSSRLHEWLDVGCSNYRRIKITRKRRG